MFHPDTYIAALTEKLRAAFGDRLVYIGLQGSYLRGEATESSDIDIMVVVDAMEVLALRVVEECGATVRKSASPLA